MDSLPQRKTRGKVTSYNTSWNLIQQRLDDALEIAQQKQLLAKYEREKKKRESSGGNTISTSSSSNNNNNNNTPNVVAPAPSVVGVVPPAPTPSPVVSNNDHHHHSRAAAVVTTVAMTAAAAVNDPKDTGSKGKRQKKTEAATIVGESAGSGKKRTAVAAAASGKKGENGIAKENTAMVVEDETSRSSEKKVTPNTKSVKSSEKLESSATTAAAAANGLSASTKKPDNYIEIDDVDARIDRALEKVDRDHGLLHPCFECGSRLTHEDHQKNIATFVRQTQMPKIFKNGNDGGGVEDEDDDDDSVIVAKFGEITYDIGGGLNGSSSKGANKGLTNDLLERLFTTGGGTGVCLRAVEIIDVRSPNAESIYNESVLNGIPVVLSGHQGLTAFAEEWVARGNLGVDGFLESCGEARAPIARRGYQGNQVSKETMPVSKFVEELFSSNDNSLYLAQWQFPLEIFKAMRKAKKSGPEEDMDVNESKTGNGRRSSSRRKRGLLNPKWFSSILPDCVGFDMLQHSCAESFVNHYQQLQLNKKQKGNKGSVENLPSKRDEAIDETDSANEKLDMSPVNPYQYLFLGGPLTYTQLHNDPGGMSILIAPIVGEKEVIMVHRDDLDLPYDIECNYEKGEEPMDGNKFPGVMLVRSWKVVLTPGDILVMPPRTFHAVRNLTPSLSYSRCHFGPIELVEMMRSYFVKDSPEMEHRRVIWNAAHALMEELTDDPTKAWANSSHSLLVTNRLHGLKGESASMKLVALRGIRSCVLMFLRFLDISSSSKNGGPFPKPVKSAPKDAASVSESTEDQNEYDWKGLLMDIDACLELCEDSFTSKATTKPAPSAAPFTSTTTATTADTPIGNGAEVPKSQPPLSEMTIHVSDVVALNPNSTCPDRQRRWANVLRVALKKSLVYIKYDVFGEEKNEYIPYENVFESFGPKNGGKKAEAGPGKPKKKKAKLSLSVDVSTKVNSGEQPVNVGDRVSVPWRVSDELVEQTMATVLEVVTEDAILLQFHHLGPEFNQWHLVKNITFVI